jgi:hypothetical protein
MAVDPKTTVPWYSPLVSALLAAGLVFIATSLKMPVAGQASTPSVGAFFTETALFIPHALILFGIIADMFAYHGGYAIASTIGLGSIPLNKGLDYFWKGIAAVIDRGSKLVQQASGTAPAATAQRGGSITNYTGCNVQGFEYFKGTYSSQTLVVTASILSFYILDLVVNKGWGAAGAAIGLGIVLFLFQGSSMSSGDCFRETGGIATTMLVSVANGLIIGGLFYGIMEAYASNLLPSKAISTIPKVNVTDLKVDSASGKLTDSSGKAWTLLPDGTPVPDTCDGLSLADLDSTGRPAAAGSCPSGGAVTAAK